MSPDVYLSFTALLWNYYILSVFSGTYAIYDNKANLRYVKLNSWEKNQQQKETSS